MTEARPRSVRQQFAHRLKELRHARGFRTARSLAQALAIDENRYTRYERAEVEPDLALLVRICEALGATPNDLLGEGGQPGGEGRLAGFAERSETALAPRHPPPAGPAGRDSAGARRALAWQLAGEWAKARAQPGAPLATLQAKSRLFADIERDPFAALARLADDPALAGLPPSDQARLAALTDELIAAVMGPL